MFDDIAAFLQQDFKQYPTEQLIFLVPVCAFLEACLGIGLFVSGIFTVSVSLLIYSTQPEMLPVILALAFTGAIASDTTGFFVGYFFSDQISKTRFIKRYEKSRERFYDLVDKSMLGAICIGRLTPALRSLTPFMAGALALRPARFLMFDAIACAIWVTGLALILILIG